MRGDTNIKSISAKYGQPKNVEGDESDDSDDWDKSDWWDWADEKSAHKTEPDVKKLKKQDNIKVSDSSSESDYEETMEEESDAES